MAPLPPGPPGPGIGGGGGPAGNRYRPAPLDFDADHAPPPWPWFREAQRGTGGPSFPYQPASYPAGSAATAAEAATAVVARTAGGRLPPSAEAFPLALGKAPTASPSAAAAVPSRGAGAGGSGSHEAAARAGAPSSLGARPQSSCGRSAETSMRGRRGGWECWRCSGQPGGAVCRIRLRVCCA